jgi:peptidoglycan/xylan/chitin deacetylase (PgdA/CDA1 family)
MTVHSIRADRLATLYFFRPLRRLVAGRGGRRIPILMYHSICRPTGQASSPYYLTETTPKIFEEHLKYFCASGYTSISLDKLVATLDSRQEDGRKQFVITFDDGYRDFYTNAFPLLSNYGFSATMFLPAAYIGHESKVFKGKECLTWAEVHEMQKAGIQFGSHTINHPQLEEIPFAQAEHEVRTSKEMLQDALGTAVHSFSYPFAFPEANRKFTSRLRDCLEQCGYRNGVTTILGSAHAPVDRFFLKRLPVNTWDDLSFLQAKAEGDYDWLHGPQVLWKRAKRKFRSDPLD